MDDLDRILKVQRPTPAAGMGPLVRLTMRLAVVLLCAAAVALPAWADSEPKLRLEPVPGRSGQHLPLAHPAEISGDELVDLLNSLTYRESGLFQRSSGQSVFSAEELSSLAPRLAEALARASASEQVRFASFSRRSGALSQLLKTEAVLFVDAEGFLNLAFAGIHEFAGPDTDFFAFLDLSDRDPLTTERSLLRLDTSAPVWATRKDRPLWAQTNLSAQPTAAGPTADPVETLETEIAAPEEHAQPTEPAATHAPEPGPDPTLEAQVRQRLEFLMGLYEDGLISQEEYEQQRREALRRLN